MTCDPRIPADEQGDIIASQAAGYRHVHDFKTGRNRIAKRAEEEKWSVERTEAAYALLDFKYGPHGEKQRLRLQRVVLNALDRRDAEFFKKLGRVFKEQATTIWKNTTRIERFLLAHWTEALGAWPALCLLTDIDLTQVCVQELRQENLSKAAVRKVRQRLRLVHSSRNLTAVRRGGQIQSFEK